MTCLQPRNLNVFTVTGIEMLTASPKNSPGSTQPKVRYEVLLGKRAGELA